MKGWTANEKFDDWSKIETNPAPPAPGLYRARITSAEPALTKGEQPKPSIKLTLELYEDASGESMRPRKVFDQLVLTKAAQWRVKLVAEALDIEPPESNGLEETEDFCRELITGSKDGCFVKIKHETYTDRNSNERTAARVDRYLTDEQVADTAAVEPSKANGVAETDGPRRPRSRAAATDTAS